MMSEASPNGSSITQRHPTIVSLQCRVCGASTRRYYLGVPTCPPCKTFFKRSVEQKQKVLQCDFGNQCEINVYNRHICSYCRLRKCFASGMQRDMLRCSYSKTSKSNRTTSIVFKESEKRSLDDRSRLSDEQWTLLSSLCHYYDEESGLAIAEAFVRDQSHLHPKCRYKSWALMQLSKALLNTTQTLYKNNPDFRLLSSDDRSMLAQTTMIYTSILSTSFIIHKVRLMDCPTYFDALGKISHPSFIPVAQRLSLRLDFDMTVMKLVFVILSFSTITTFHSKTPSQTFSNVKQIFYIQNTYVDLLWRYLVHECNFIGAVRCFSDVVRCLFAVNECVICTLDVQWYVDAIEQMKHSLDT